MKSDERITIYWNGLTEREQGKLMTAMMILYGGKKKRNEKG